MGQKAQICTSAEKWVSASLVIREVDVYTFRRGSKCYFAGKTRRLRERLFRNLRMVDEVRTCGRYSETELGKVYMGNNSLFSVIGA